MNEQEQMACYRDVLQQIRQGSLKQAFEKLLKWEGEIEGFHLREKLNFFEQNYRYMLQYAVAGAEDPDRSKIYESIKNELYKLLEQTKKYSLGKTSARYPFSELRNREKVISHSNLKEQFSKHYESLELLNSSGKSSQGLDRDQQEAYERCQDDLFIYFLKRDTIEDQEVRLLSVFKKYGEYAEHELILIVNALMLNVMMGYESSMYSILINLAQSPILNIQARAWLALVLCSYLNKDQIQRDKRITDEFASFMEQQGYQQKMEVLLLELSASKETEKVSQKLQEEILPEIVKASSKLKGKLDIESLIQESTEDKNPEWEDFFSDTPELQDRMMELNELQMEGADVFMATFAQLKHYPFFQKGHHWFLPFSRTRSEMALAKGSKMWDVLGLVEQSSIMCDSDKFSLALSLGSIGEEQAEAFYGQLEAESQMIKEREQEQRQQSGQGLGEFRLQVKLQIQNLYRFFRLYKPQPIHKDIFRLKLDVHNLWFPGHGLAEDTIEKLANYAFSKKRYNEAYDLFKTLEEKGRANAELFQKQGFSLQVRGSYEGAIDRYKKADVLKSNDYWTIRKLAQCYKHLKDSKEALKYFQQADQLKPDNLPNLISIGNCLLELEQYDEALSLFFKIDYMDEGNPKVHRAIVWCSFIVGKYDQAANYAQKNLSQNPTIQDYINMGNIYWMKKDLNNAIQFYKQGCLAFNLTADEFHKQFKVDKDWLQKKGVARQEIDMIIDHMLYETYPI